MIKKNRLIKEARVIKMRLMNKVKKAIKMDKRKALSTAKAIIHQYGFKSLLIATLNKVRSRPLLMNIDDNFCNHVVSPREMEEAGNRVLQRQQSELSTIEMRAMMDSFHSKPLISVVMPLYNSPVKWLRRAIESLQEQVYENWELCAVDDGSKDRRCITLMNEMMAADPRIRLICQKKNGGISAASNVSLEMAKGEYIALLDHDDEIPEDAFFWFAKEINDHPEADFIYSDECKINAGEKSNREFSCFYLKPDWSPFLLINHMYTGHLTVYRTSVVRAVGGFRTHYDFSQDYDLALRVSDVTKNIRHIERVLYFWRIIPASAASGAKDYARVSNMAALRDWYARRDLNVVMERTLNTNYGSLIMETSPKVSIIIPSDSYKNLMECFDGLLCNTSYKNIELIPVTNGKTAAAIHSELHYLEQLNICLYDKTYNFSDKCNDGAAIATGDILIFLNDDVVPYSKDWVERLIEVLNYSEVGGVSPLLLHTDDTVQYAGMITGTPGLIGTSFNNIPNTKPVPNPYKHVLLRDVSVLCGACVAIYKTTFYQIGGFDAIHTPAAHSDLDLSLKLIEAGYRCVFNPHAILTHVGNHSWENKNKAEKADIFCLQRWGKYLEKDPYFTNSMKEMFYKDFPFKYEINSPDNLVLPQSEKSRDILFITHELSRTGAPAVLLDLVEIVLKNGDFPVVVSMQDGPLKQSFLDLGVTVIIDESIQQRHWIFERFARNFDLVVVNTIASYDAIYTLSNSLPPVLWWIHEGSFAFSMMKAQMPKKVGNNVHIYSICDYTTTALANAGFGSYRVNSLPWGIRDFSQDSARVPNEKFMFVISGSLEERKGQDIVIEAISKQDPQSLSNAKFIFVGKTLDENIHAIISQAAISNPSIEYINSLSRSEALHLYAEADCMIVASRDDPMPLVSVESFILSKPIICSDHTGTATYLNDNENGMIFASGNSDELAAKITFAIQNRDRMQAMGIQARKIYDEHFAYDVYRERVLSVVSGLIEREI